MTTTAFTEWFFIAPLIAILVWRIYLYVVGTYQAMSIIRQIIAIRLIGWAMHILPEGPEKLQTAFFVRASWIAGMSGVKDETFDEVRQKFANAVRLYKG